MKQVCIVIKDLNDALTYKSYFKGRMSHYMNSNNFYIILIVIHKFIKRDIDHAKSIIPTLYDVIPIKAGADLLFCSEVVEFIDFDYPSSPNSALLAG